MQGWRGDAGIPGMISTEECGETFTAQTGHGAVQWVHLQARNGVKGWPCGVWQRSTRRAAVSGRPETRGLVPRQGQRGSPRTEPVAPVPAETNRFSWRLLYSWLTVQGTPGFLCWYCVSPIFFLNCPSFFYLRGEVWGVSWVAILAAQPCRMMVGDGLS